MRNNLQKEASIFSLENPAFVRETLKLILEEVKDDNHVAWKIGIIRFFEQHLGIKNHQITFSNTNEVIIEKILVKLKTQNKGLDNKQINQLLKDALLTHQTLKMQLAGQLLPVTEKPSRRWPFSFRSKRKKRKRRK